MKPALTRALVATLLVSAGLALWTEPPEAAATAAIAGLVAPARRPVDRVATAPTAPSTAEQATATPAAQPAPQLPTRAADWPAPSPAGLAAWQAVAATVAVRPAAAASAALAARAVVRPAPVFPYHWIGQLDDGSGAPQQLLASAQRSVGVRLGATLDGRWRLQRDPAGRLLAQALPDGEPVAVPGAPLAPAALP